MKCSWKSALSINEYTKKQKVLLDWRNLNFSEREHFFGADFIFSHLFFFYFPDPICSTWRVLSIIEDFIELPSPFEKKIQNFDCFSSEMWNPHHAPPIHIVNF